jgi:hypothetical protein
LTVLRINSAVLQCVIAINVTVPTAVRDGYIHDSATAEQITFDEMVSKLHLAAFHVATSKGTPETLDIRIKWVDIKLERQGC